MYTGLTVYILMSILCQKSQTKTNLTKHLTAPQSILSPPNTSQVPLFFQSLIVLALSFTRKNTKKHQRYIQQSDPTLIFYHLYGFQQSDFCKAAGIVPCKGIVYAWICITNPWIHIVLGITNPVISRFLSWI